MLVGMDAVALFPSMSGRTTGRIVRKRIGKTTVKMEGFNWKKAAVYIRINKELLTKTEENKEMDSQTYRYLPI